MALKDTVQTMKKLLSDIGRDLEKGAAGNKAASQRVRVNTIKLEKIAKVYRKESVTVERKNGKSSSKGSGKKSASKAARKKR